MPSSLGDLQPVDRRNAGFLARPCRMKSYKHGCLVGNRAMMGPKRVAAKMRGDLMSRLRIGIIGLGMAVTPHARSLVDLAERVEVAYAFSPSPARDRKSTRLNSSH